MLKATGDCGHGDDSATDGLYQGLLGAEWDELPAAVRRAHDGRPLSGRGCFHVRWSRWPWLRGLAWVCGLPRPGVDVPVELEVEPDASGETWRRRFAGRPFVTRQWREGPELIERSGPLELRFRLRGGTAGLVFEPRGARLGRLPLPAWLSPRVVASVRGEDELEVAVRLEIPALGELCRYAGRLEVPPEAAAAAPALSGPR